MKHLVIFLMLFFSISSVLFGQLEEKMKKEGVVKGTIIKNGKATDGFIKILGKTYHDDKWYPAPWEFQSKIKFIPTKTFENTEKVKNKHFEKYDAKDIDGYTYDSLVYESVKYADMSAVGMNMLPKKMFMRRIADDKISLYVHFYEMPDVMVYEGNEYVELLEENAKPNLVYKIGKNGKLKLVNNLNIEKELSDCPQIVEKQKKGEYKVVGKDGEEASGLKKVLNNSVFREDVRLQAIQDYNENCN
ncbi:hypothetical protein [Marinilabilia salmonicolor]|uniref:hypothetical protein n=1 Tax=Marinilabilia salmonicolor TaxID=989 RepID=UPI00029B11F3|nr:hypothetical protein [Marinilabilia salmonicolor]